MAFGGKAPSLAILLGSKPGEDGDDDGDLMKEEMKKFMSAIKDDDADAALEAYQNLCDLHMEEAEARKASTAEETAEDDEAY